MTTLTQLHTTLDVALKLMRAVTPDDLAKPSVCEGWDIKALANHMVRVCDMFGRAAAGERFESYGEPVDFVGTDPAGAYARGVDLAKSGFGAAGALERTLILPPGPRPAPLALSILLMDQLLHTWDLATSLGRAVTLEPGLVEDALGTLQAVVTPDRRGDGKPYGNEISVGPGASALERLLACSGRSS